MGGRRGFSAVTRLGGCVVIPLLQFQASSSSFSRESTTNERSVTNSICSRNFQLLLEFPETELSSALKRA